MRTHGSSITATSIKSQRAPRERRSAIRKIGVLVTLALLTLMAGVVAAQPPTPTRPENPLPWIVSQPDVAPISIFERQSELRAVGKYVQTPPARQDPFQIIDGCVQQEMDQLNVPGAQIAIALDGEIVYERGYGVKHSLEGGEVDRNTLFRIGSITKMMTAGAVMQQVDQGRVDLQAPVTRYVPELQISGPWPASDITVWNLLTHSSGFPEQPLSIDGPKTVTALSEWAGAQSDVQLYAPPGSFWNYSNQNFSLAGLVAERASRVPYHQYMKGLWTTAGMTRTTLLPADVLAYDNYTHGHYTNPLTGEPIINPETGQQFIFAPDAYDNWWVAPAGLAFSTAGDLVRWALLLMDGGGAVLSPESATAMQDEQVSVHTIPGQYYGYGIIGGELWGAEILNHGGNVPGWGAMLLWVPERRFAVSVLANASPSMGNSTVCATAVMLGLQPPETPPDYSTDPDTWGRYTGTYHILDYELFGIFEPAGAEYEAEVTKEGDELRVSASLLDPIHPTVPFSRTLTQGYLDTFFLDFDLDGQLDPILGLTFIDDPESPGEAKWMRNRLFVGTQAAMPQGTDSLTARVFIDYRCDGFFQDGLDIPMRDASVTFRFPNGARAIRQVRPFGLLNFSGFDASDGLAVTVKLPESYRGYALDRCANSPGSLRLQPDEFRFGYKSVQFSAKILGEAAAP